MKARSHPKRWDVSSTALVLANAVPLAGVLFFHWQIFPLVFLYWLENVVVGVFNVFRLMLADPDPPTRWPVKLLLIPLFCAHFGFFAALHGSAVFAFFGKRLINPAEIASVVPEVVRQTGIGLALLPIIASHAFSFTTNYVLGGEYQRASLNQIFSQPYRRVVVLHLTILASALALVLLGSPLIGVILLVMLKTGIDVTAHRAERRKLAEPSPRAM